MNQTTLSVDDPLSCDDSLSEASDSEATDDNEDEGIDMDYISDEDEKDPDWNILEEAAENEEIGDDEEQSGSVASQNNIR